MHLVDVDVDWLEVCMRQGYQMPCLRVLRSIYKNSRSKFKVQIQGQKAWQWQGNAMKWVFMAETICIALVQTT